MAFEKGATKGAELCQQLDLVTDAAKA